MPSARPGVDSLGDGAPCGQKANPLKRPARLEPSPLPLKPQLVKQSISNVSSVPNCTLTPSSIDCRGSSPAKVGSRPRTFESGQGKLAFPPINTPLPSEFKTDSPSKNPPFGHGLQAASSALSSMPPVPLACTTSQDVRWENNSSHRTGSDGSTHPAYQKGPKSPVKRSMIEGDLSKDRPTKTQRAAENSIISIPEPHEMPPIEDDGEKPPYSYATLIGMSILRSPNRRLTLAQIYKWISDMFSFYRNSDSGWQNSIRHNLSLNKAFIKQERPKDDPGKGNYWAIEAGMEAQFLKDRHLRRTTLSNISLSPTALQRELPSFCQEPSTVMWKVLPPTISVSRAVKNPDLSSDATLPASDPALQEEVDDEEGLITKSQILRSSSPQAIYSSPPVAPSRFIRPGSPPTPPHAVASSTVISRSRKRKCANDSGYFSSLESSVLKTSKVGNIPTSELDIEPPRIKRGRAEEEIARIRSSSHDISPRQPCMPKDKMLMTSSSPFGREYMSLLPPPLTPVVKFKKPAKPPASLSPNTNLRNHRRRIQQMVNSPIKNLGITDEELPWSPAFNMPDETSTPNHSSNLSFDIFTDTGDDNIKYGSPGKVSAKRARTDMGTIGNVLSEITATSGNRRINTPATSNRFKHFCVSDSPSKVIDSNCYADATNDDFFSFSLFDESPGEADGIDLLQGFQKIGGANKDGHFSKGYSFRSQVSHPNHTVL